MAIVEHETIKILRTLEFWRMAILWTFSLIYSYFLLFLSDVFAYFRPQRVSRPCDSGSQEERVPGVCVITGATSGLGAASAKVLAGKGYHVVLGILILIILFLSTASWTFHADVITMEEIKLHVNSAKLKAFHVDMSSMDSLLQFKRLLEEWLSNSDVHPSIQLLINNAGILAATSRTTVDGYGQTMETNYISPFLLTNLLWPFLRESNVPSRVVNVTSFTHRCVFNPPGMMDQSLKYCISGLDNYPMAHVYEYTKFWILVFTYELNRKLSLMDLSSKVSVVAADPRAVKTNIMRELPKPISKLAFTFLKLFHLLQTPEDGVASIIDAAMAPSGISGKYFFGGNGRTVRSSNLSCDSKLGRDLWSSSMVVLREAVSCTKDCNGA